MEKPKLLIVDDDEELRIQLKWALAQDYDVLLAQDRKSALDVLRDSTPLTVILDLGLPPHPASVEEGFSTLQEILSTAPSTKVIIVTGRGEKPHALKAIGEGAYDFLSKPVELEELKIILRRAFYVALLEREYAEVQKRIDEEPLEGMLGTDPKIQEVFSSVRKVATTDVPVLITGESGTGKELVARAIHRLSGRKANPFVVINCAAIPENLLESELFGHEKGAFTGAHAQRKGRFEMAHGGTLFLDEIGELSPPLQIKLLRFLQEQRIERVGGREQIVVDARIVAATNRELKQAIGEGRFREDLYYRLGVVTVFLPALRDRGEDVLLIANALLKRFSMEKGGKNLKFSERASNAIRKHHWPGNIRELENRVKRAIIMTESERISPADLELTPEGGKEGHQTLKEAREALEKDLILKALSRNRGNISKAAADLDISRPTLYDLMSKLGISTAGV